MKKILIFGGTGFVGTQVCEKLNQSSCRVTVATRRSEHARHLQLLPLVDVIEIDLNDSAALAALVAGHDAVVNLIAILHGSEEAFQKVHVQWPLNLIRACKAADVRRMVHISALGASVDSASKYQRSKARGEAALLGSGLDVTVLRPSVIFGAGDSFLNTFANLQQVFPVIPLAGSGYIGINQGKGRPVIGLPDALARIQAFFMELAPGNPVLSRDNLDAMKTDNVATGKLPGLQALGITPAALAAIAPTYLGARGLRSGLMAKRKTAGRF